MSNNYDSANELLTDTQRTAEIAKELFRTTLFLHLHHLRKYCTENTVPMITSADSRYMLRKYSYLLGTVLKDEDEFEVIYRNTLSVVNNLDKLCL